MFVQTQLFTKQECDRIIESIPTLNKVNGNEKYGADENVDVSFDEFKVITNSETEWFMEKIKLFVKKSLNVELKILNNDAHILRYGINDGFSKHMDYNPNNDTRVYTIGLLLNDSFEGGDLIIYLNNDKINLNKIIGNVYLFDTLTPHEVTKITKGVRYTLIIHVTNSEIKKISLL